jgi:hypothetical protein
MIFTASEYGGEVAAILALDGGGARLMPLAGGTCSSAEAARRLKAASPGKLFPGARAPEAALSGLWLYFSCLDESHKLSQEIASAEGSFWHGIMHRQEPDAGNASYWFGRVGRHPVFAPLRDAAAEIVAASKDAGFPVGAEWDAFAFVDFCDAARRKPGSGAERLAREIQRAEWQLLFDYCARPAPKA